MFDSNILKNSPERAYIAIVKCEIKFRLAGVNSGTPDVTSAQSRFLPCQLFQSAGVQGLAPGMK